MKLKPKHETHPIIVELPDNVSWYIVIAIQLAGITVLLSAILIAIT